MSLGTRLNQFKDEVRRAKLLGLPRLDCRVKPTVQMAESILNP